MCIVSDDAFKKINTTHFFKKGTTYYILQEILKKQDNYSPISVKQLESQSARLQPKQALEVYKFKVFANVFVCVFYGHIRDPNNFIRISYMTIEQNKIAISYVFNL